MAAGEGFKTWNTGDVLSANDVNGYLMQGIWVFDDAADRTAQVTAPSEGNFSYLKDTNKLYYYTGAAWAEADTAGILPSEFTAKGDILVGTGSATFDNLPVGTNGHVLTADSATSTGVKWAALSSGTVVQFKTAALTTTASTTSTSFTDTGLSVTITPTSASNDILIFASVSLATSGTTAGSFLTLTDGSNNNLINASSPSNRTPAFVRNEAGGGNEYTMSSYSLVLKHSPATTSAFTYKIRHSVTSGATSLINRIIDDLDLVAYSRGVSTIIVMEVIP